MEPKRCPDKTPDTEGAEAETLKLFANDAGPHETKEAREQLKRIAVELEISALRDRPR